MVLITEAVGAGEPTQVLSAARSYRPTGC
jgi:hypothetical protein